MARVHLIVPTASEEISRVANAQALLNPSAITTIRAGRAAQARNAKNIGDRAASILIPHASALHSGKSVPMVGPAARNLRAITNILRRANMRTGLNSPTKNMSPACQMAAC